MLDKNVDMLILGKNFVSFILSIQLLDHGKKVLLLSDDKVQFGEVFSGYIGPLERSFLKICGEDRRIMPFVDLDCYLTLQPMSFYFAKKRLRLGQSPYLNLRELQRKILPQLRVDDGLNPDEFDKVFYDYTYKLGKYFFRHKELPGLSMDDFMEQCPIGLNLLFDIFSEALIGEVTHVRPVKNVDLACFFYQAKAIYQKRLGLCSSRFELFHLFLCLLSPQFLIDQNRLVNDLLKTHRERGGAYKDNCIKDWIFDKGRPWSLELDSFEGVIHPKQISLCGGMLRRMKMGPLSNFSSYTAAHAYIKVKNKKVLQEFSEEKIIFSTPRKMGTSQPFWILEALDNELKVSVFHLLERGLKMIFKAKKLEKIVREELRELFPWSSEHFGEFKFVDSYEILIEDQRPLEMYGKNSAPVMKDSSLVDLSSPGKRRPLKEVYYFGPQKQASMGLFSSLMEVKNQQRFL